MLDTLSNDSFANNPEKKSKLSKEGVMSTIPQEKLIPRHHIARKTLYAVGQKTTQIIERSKEKGGVVKFGIETMERLVEPAKSFTVRRWSTYGDPLIRKLDRKLDEAFFAIAPHSPDDGEIAVSNSPDDETHKTVYFLYWGRLKDKFVSSQWFTLCNQILMQNVMVQAVTQKVYQPAEMFYNTVTDEFVGNESLEQYLEALKERMGPTWDDRLTALARAFYTTAKAVTAIVGAGRFVGGALQLGKSKIHTAIDDLLTRWDRVLGVTDDMLDQWLPEEEKLRKREKVERKGSVDEDAEIDYERDSFEEGIFRMEEDDDLMAKEAEVDDTLPKQLLRGGSASQPSKQLLVELGHLVILPWTLINQIGSELRKSLLQGSPSWFTHVDEVLLQNTLVKAISQGVIRPAEHFFNTAVDVFRSYYISVDTFLVHLVRKLGSTWDERLLTPAKSFFTLAVDLSKIYGQDRMVVPASSKLLSISSVDELGKQD